MLARGYKQKMLPDVSFTVYSGSCANLYPVSRFRESARNINIHTRLGTWITGSDGGVCLVLAWGLIPSLSHFCLLRALSLVGGGGELTLCALDMC